MPKLGETERLFCPVCNKDTDQEFKNGASHLEDVLTTVYHISEIFHCNCGTYNYREFRRNQKTGEKSDFIFTHVLKSKRWAKQRFTKTPDWVREYYNNLVEALNNDLYENFGVQLKLVLESTIEETRVQIAGKQDEDYGHIRQNIDELVQFSVFTLGFAKGLKSTLILIDQLTNGHYQYYINGMQRDGFLRHKIRLEIDERVFAAVKIIENAIHLCFEVEQMAYVLNENPQSDETH